jgi:flagellar basal body-associated protein FliL
MADEELLEPVDEMDEEEEEEEGGGGSPLMRYLPLIIGVLVVQVIIIWVVMGYFSSSDEAAAPEDQMMAAEEAVAGSEDGAEGAASGVGDIDEFLYETLEPIVVNPAGTEGLRFLSATVHLGLANAGVETEIDAKRKKSRIVDALHRILSSKTIPQLDPERHNELKDEIKRDLNDFLGANAVIDVYFQGFVLQ